MKRTHGHCRSQVADLKETIHACEVLGQIYMEEVRVGYGGWRVCVTSVYTQRTFFFTLLFLFSNQPSIPSIPSIIYTVEQQLPAAGAELPAAGAELPAACAELPAAGAVDTRSQSQIGPYLGTQYRGMGEPRRQRYILRPPQRSSLAVRQRPITLRNRGCAGKDNMRTRRNPSVLRIATPF